MDKGSMGRCATCEYAFILTLAVRPNAPPETSFVGDRVVWCDKMRRKISDLLPAGTMVQNCSVWRDRKGSGRARPS